MCDRQRWVVGAFLLGEILYFDNSDTVFRLPMCLSSDVQIGRTCWHIWMAKHTHRRALTKALPLKFPCNVPCSVHSSWSMCILLWDNYFLLVKRTVEEKSEAQERKKPRLEVSPLCAVQCLQFALYICRTPMYWKTRKGWQESWMPQRKCLCFRIRSGEMISGHFLCWIWWATDMQIRMLIGVFRPTETEHCRVHTGSELSERS